MRYALPNLVPSLILACTVNASFPEQVKLTSMQRAWACACALPADSNAPQAPALLDLDHAELLCSDTKNLWPAQCDKRWFCDEFCDGRGLDRELAESVWDLVTMRAPVETVALMACVSGLVEEFYRPEAA